MRILLLTALLASVAAPAMAAPRHDRADSSERSAERAERPQRAERQERAERPQRAERQERTERPQRVERQASPDRSVRQVREVRQVERVAHPDANDSVRNWRPAEQRVRVERTQPVTQRVVRREPVHDVTQRRAERIGDRTERRADRAETREARNFARRPVTNVAPPPVSRVPVQGTQPPLRTANRDGTRTRDGNHHRWNGDWRSDRRYDWRRWRDRNRSIFRIGVYFDPFGWNYRRYNVGWRLWPSYYSSRYWINDPYMYRLPYAPPGYQWIRYYNDAVLVDTWSGEVADVIYNFFW